MKGEHKKTREEMQERRESTEQKRETLGPGENSKSPGNGPVTEGGEAAHLKKFLALLCHQTPFLLLNHQQRLLHSHCLVSGTQERGDGFVGRGGGLHEELGSQEFTGFREGSRLLPAVDVTEWGRVNLIYRSPRGRDPQDNFWVTKMKTKTKNKHLAKPTVGSRISKSALFIFRCISFAVSSVDFVWHKSGKILTLLSSGAGV